MRTHGKRIFTLPQKRRKLRLVVEDEFNRTGVLQLYYAGEKSIPISTLSQQRTVSCPGCSVWTCPIFLRPFSASRAGALSSKWKRSMLLMELKRDSDTEWLREADCQVLQQSLKDLDQACRTSLLVAVDIAASRTGAPNKRFDTPNG